MPTKRSGRPPARSPDGSRPTRTILFGSGSFAVPILDVLADHPSVELVAVITVPPRAAGRHAQPRETSVAARAREIGAPVVAPASLRDDATAASVAGLDARLGVLADYGRIVPGSLIEAFPLGILNVHPSLLPRWRGASPIPATIASGDAEAGVTIISMDAGIDTGPIVAQERWALAGDEDAVALRVEAAARGASLLARTADPWITGEPVPAPQGAVGVTETRTLRRDDGRLDATRPAAELERHVRALRGWPGAFLETGAGRLAVWSASVAPSQPSDRAGTLVMESSRPALATTSGRLVLEAVQPSGGRAMDGADWARGRGRTWIGSRVAGTTTMDPWMRGT